MIILCDDLRRQTANMKSEVGSDTEEEGSGVQITQGWADSQTLDLTNVPWRKER